MSPIDQPKSGVDSDKLYGNVKQMLESALPSSVQGMVSGDTSGYALNQAAYLARLQWDPIVKNAEVALGERVGHESWIIENRIAEKVYAWGEIEATRGKKTISGQSKAAWLALGPEDLKGVHRYEATLAPSTPSNEIVATRAIGEKMQLKLITYEDAVEQSGSNPDEVEKSWLLHDLKNSQEVQAMLKKAVFEKVATIQTERMAAAGAPSPQELAGQPTAGATGVPGGTPGVPNPGQPGGMPPNPVPSPALACRALSSRRAWLVACRQVGSRATPMCRARRPTCCRYRAVGRNETSCASPQPLLLLVRRAQRHQWRVLLK